MPTKFYKLGFRIYKLIITIPVTGDFNLPKIVSIQLPYDQLQVSPPRGTDR